MSGISRRVFLGSAAVVAAGGVGGVRAAGNEDASAIELGERHQFPG